ncbi:MAG: hypothetical protein WD048_16555 [Chitinophagales bacterium]
MKLQRMRLQLENEFLEEKLSDNYELAKYELKPAQLLDTYVQRNFNLEKLSEGEGSWFQTAYRVLRLVLKAFSK